MEQESVRKHDRRTIREIPSETRDIYAQTMDPHKGAQIPDRVGIEVDHKKGSIRVWSENHSDEN